MSTFYLYQPVEIIERDDDGYIDEQFYALYAGEDMSDSEYEDSYHFWLWIERYKMWERHAFRKSLDVDFQLNDEEIKRMIGYIFEAKKWTISS